MIFSWTRDNLLSLHYIFLDQKVVIMKWYFPEPNKNQPECRNDNLLSKESNGEKSRDHLWLQDFARAAISLLIRTIKSNSSKNKVQSTLNLISPDMWINIEHVMCVVPKCCHALWEPHKYLDVPKNILMYLKIAWCTSEQDFEFCF